MKKTALIVAIAFFMAAGSSKAVSASPDQSTAVRRRLAMESAARDNPFLILPHRPNYILPLAYNLHPNDEASGLEPGTLDELEMTFQVSLKVHLSELFPGNRGNLYAAYTSRSWWQAYSGDRSRPFRETNHEPELFLLYDTDWSVLGLRASSVIFGVSHQSNGQDGALSRSWNRIYTSIILERGNAIVSVKPWYRIPEREKDGPDDPDGDDNPDIRTYMGSGELGVFFRRARHTLTLTLRNNLRRENKGSVELGYSYPLTAKMKGYLQIFDGYGESLIDYDHRMSRVGVGILLADWL
ncbi:MAG: phospholipase A [bacterium]|nr:phospholipase A [bacterium]MDT8395586.1 phospholipase A [bacterium]